MLKKLDFESTAEHSVLPQGKNYEKKEKRKETKLEIEKKTYPELEKNKTKKRQN